MFVVAKTGNHPPGPYGKDTIRSLLKNEVYTGLVTYKGESMPGNQPIIVDSELFAKAQHVRKLRGNTPHSDRETARAKARVFPLTGILRCAGCGGKNDPDAKYCSCCGTPLA